MDASAAPPPADPRVVHLSGAIDLASGPGVLARIQRAASYGFDVVADLSEVDFIDCAGLRALLSAQELLVGRLWLRALSPSVAWLLGATDTTAMFAVLPPERPAVLTSLPSTATLVGSDAVELQIAGSHEVQRAQAVREQAKGLLMGAHGCSAREASQMLRRAARDHDVRERDVAAALVHGSTRDTPLTPGAAVQRALAALSVVVTGR